MKVILASASPRRRDLIATIDGLEAEIVPSRADESVEKSSDPAVRAENLALMKAKDVYAKTAERLSERTPSWLSTEKFTVSRARRTKPANT